MIVTVRLIPRLDLNALLDREKVRMDAYDCACLDVAILTGLMLAVCNDMNIVWGLFGVNAGWFVCFSTAAYDVYLYDSLANSFLDCGNRLEVGFSGDGVESVMEFFCSLGMPKDAYIRV